MKIINNTFLIVIAVSFLALGGYTYFSNNPNVLAAPSSISSQSGESPIQSVTKSEDSKISVDTAFLLTLSSLKKITIDTSIFESKAFKRLNDNTVSLEQTQTGRPNPFAPIDAVLASEADSLYVVITNQPVKVVSKTAVLSGTVTTTEGVVGTYFEYGPTPSLGKVTMQTTPSLIGTFILTVNGLNPQTTYFYRAVAKVNGTQQYGEIVSFETQ